jgi:uncharacterized membrane protein YjgN (DUF898 family)
MIEPRSGIGGMALPTSPIVLDFTQKLPAASQSGAALPYDHEIRFTGSGSEYFRIWIVNLLLTLVTLSLYYPWAKVRKLRYFHTNTHVAGHALDFHGEPLKMLRGHLLILALAGAYALAGEVAPEAQGVALVILALLWPALWRASLQFRLANTSWRGLRLRFAGSLKGAYGALLAPIVGFALIGGGVIGTAAAWKSPTAAVLLASVLVLGFYGSLPWLWLRIKRYQHDHYGCGRIQTRLDASTGAAYGVFMRTAGIATLAVLVAICAVAVIGVVFGARVGNMGEAAATLSWTLPLMALVFLFAQVLPRAYATSRLQNLLWSHTGVHSLRFASALRFVPLAGLLLKNWLLVILTLGLYWPWAAIATARLRLEAVSLHTRSSLDAMTAGEQAQRGDAAGDAAGDVFGIDFGL